MENLTNTTPADEIASTTPATETSREPVIEQAPSVETVVEPVTTQAPTAQTDTPAVANLPEGYGNLMETTPDGKQRFPKRDYVGRYAKELAAALTTGTPPLTAAAFNSAFLRDAKKALRRDTPVGLMLTTAASFEVQAIKLVAKNKAPALLVDMMHALVPAVTDAKTYRAAYNHLDSVYTFMLQIERQKGGDT